MNTILTDDEIVAVKRGVKLFDTNPWAESRAFGRAIEAALLAKLREQEPVAHRYRFGNVWMFDTCRWNGQDADEVVPVYLRPMPKHQDHDPCMGKNCGKTCYDQEHSAECIDETAKSQGWHTKLAVVQVPREWRELMREARDNCKASIAEDGISAVRREYRKELLERMNALLAAAPEAPAQADHTELLRMITHRAKCFPGYPLGYHIPEVFAAIGEEPPQPEAPAQEAPAPGYCKHCEQYTVEEPLKAALPAVVREAIKVAREALHSLLFTADDSPSYDASITEARAALARLDALGGVE